MLHSFQGALPHLPLPSLDHTLNEVSVFIGFFNLKNYLASSFITTNNNRGRIR